MFINLVNSDVIYFWVINDWLTTAEGDSAATLGCGFRGVRRESEGKSRGRSLQLRVRLPLAGRDDDQGGMTPPTLLLGCLRAPGSRGSRRELVDSSFW